MPISRCRLHLRTTVPPGDSLVGAQPQHLFRIERFFLPEAPDLFLVRGGQLIPCDGRMHENTSHERTLCVGAFFAFHIRNQVMTPRWLELTVSGIGIDTPEEYAPEVLLGTFAQDFSVQMSEVQDD
jgi:hypothetical protein